MKNLKCNAHNCIYNKNYECFAGRINVDGSMAEKTSDTYCSTFRENEHPSLSNHSEQCCHKECSVGTAEIRCEAVNCKYNENKLCLTSSVQINDVDASCNTFVAR